MSDQGQGESESMKAARNVPPLPHERTYASDASGGGSLSMAMPLLLSVGGAVAAAAMGALAEKKSGALSRAADWTRDELEDWYDSAKHSAKGRAHDVGEWGESLLSSGAKAAGVAGLLKALGSGNLSKSAATAAKALAAKKVAEYAASGTKSAGRFAKRHPAMTAGGAAAAFKARSAWHEGSDRAHDAWSVLRHGRQSVQQRESMGGQVATGVALLGVGAAAMYLFHPDQGQHRRRMLREQLFGSGRRAASSFQHGYHTTQERMSDVYDTARQRASEAYRNVTHRASVQANRASEQASKMSEQAADAAKSAREGATGDTGGGQ